MRLGPLLTALTCLLVLSGAQSSVAQTPPPRKWGDWGPLRLELGGAFGHAFPGAPCIDDCGDGLRPGSAWSLQAVLRYRMVGVAVARESATFPWAIEAASYRAPGASISTGATLIAFRAWLRESAAINPYLQLGVGSADYEVNEPGGVCAMNPGTAWQAGVGLDVRVLPFLKYNIAWSTRTAAPEVICNWSLRHPSGVPVPSERAVTAHTLSLGASFVLGEGW